VFDVPAGLLVDGKNVLAASVHANYRATTDLSFDLAFTATRGQAPAAVTGLTGTATTNAVALKWTAPTGGVAPASYTISRAGKVVGSVTAPTTTFTDTGLAAKTAYDYTVVAVGSNGLTSAPVAAQVTTTAAPVAGVTVPTGSTWAWRYSNDPLPSDWNAVGFDASAWKSGAGVLARGVADAATDIDQDDLATKPLSAQFRHVFTVSDTAGLKDGTVTVRADDGVAVYLNGVELGRANLPSGPITQNTYATAAPRATVAAANTVTFTVPASLIKTGTNVIAASVHANYRATADLSFDLVLSAPRG
jgi:hypothetical protein